MLAVLFCLPALYNRHPLIYPDSVGYFSAGSAAIDAFLPSELSLSAPAHAMAPGAAGNTANPRHVRPPAKSMKDRAADGTSTSRSPYYGAVLVVLTRLGGEWGLALVQVLISVISLLLAARHLGKPKRIPLLLVAAATGLVAGLGIFSTTIMPDVFTGLAILALAILLTCFRSLSAVERAYWLLLLLVSCLFHKANLAASALLAMAALGYLWMTARRDIGLAAALLGTLVLAAFGHLVVNIAVEKTSGRPPVQTPFLLARLVGDGTAIAYLKQHCPERHYRLCDFLPRMPMTENDFLWGSIPPKTVMKTASVDDQAAISAEQQDIVNGVLAEYPFTQLKVSTGNFLRQLADVGVTEYGLAVDVPPGEEPGMETILENYKTSRVAEGTMPLDGLSIVMLAAYLAGFAGLIALLLSQSRANLPRQMWEIAAVLVAGVVINAAVSGVIAGVFDRYQGRVAWLIPFAAALLWIQAISRTRATTSVQPAR